MQKAPIELGCEGYEGGGLILIQFLFKLHLMKSLGTPEKRVVAMANSLNEVPENTLMMLKDSLGVPGCIHTLYYAFLRRKGVAAKNPHRLAVDNVMGVGFIQDHDFDSPNIRFLSVVEEIYFPDPLIVSGEANIIATLKENGNWDEGLEIRHLWEGIQASINLITSVEHSGVRRFKEISDQN